MATNIYDHRVDRRVTSEKLSSSIGEHEKGWTGMDAMHFLIH